MIRTVEDSLVGMVRDAECLGEDPVQLKMVTALMERQGKHESHDVPMKYGRGSARHCGRV